VRVDNVPSQGGSASIGIRGVQQTDPGLAFDPSVGVYEDGIYNPRLSNASLMFLDLERIEILKGPQGTLFGKNTSGGAVVVNSRRPDGTLGGWLRGRVGEDSLYGLEGAVGYRYQAHSPARGVALRLPTAR
jgi:iron complex outermembrane receptor protein